MRRRRKVAGVLFAVSLAVFAFTAWMLVKLLWSVRHDSTTLKAMGICFAACIVLAIPICLVIDMIGKASRKRKADQRGFEVVPTVYPVDDRD